MLDFIPLKTRTQTDSVRNQSRQKAGKYKKLYDSDAMQKELDDSLFPQPLEQTTGFVFPSDQFLILPLDGAAYIRTNSFSYWLVRG